MPARRPDLFAVDVRLALVLSGACLLGVSCDRHDSARSSEGAGEGSARVAESSSPVTPERTPGVTAGAIAGHALPADLDPAVAELLRPRLAALAERPDDARLQLEVGMIYDGNSLPSLAAEAYAVAARLDPTSMRALYHLGRKRLELGDVDGALAALEGCASSASPAVLGLLGDCRLDAGQLELARQAYLNALEADPGHPAGPEGLARVSLALGQPQNAVGTLEAALQRNPQRGHARFLLGTAYRQLGRLDDAARELAAAEGSTPAWPDPWLDEVGAFVAGYRGVMERAVEAGRAGQADAVLDELVALQRAHPDDVAALEKLVAAALQTGQVDLARDALARFDAARPGHPRALYLSALLHEAQGQSISAIKAVRRSIQLQQGWVPAYELEARLHWKRGDHRAAAASLELALQHGGASLDTLLKLARAQTILEDGEAATATLRRATGAFPTSTDAWWAWLQDAAGRGARDDVLAGCLALGPLLDADDPRTQVVDGLLEDARGG